MYETKPYWIVRYSAKEVSCKKLKKREIEYGLSMVNLKYILTIVLVVSALAVVGCTDSTYDENQGSDEQYGNDMPEGIPSPDEKSETDSQESEMSGVVAVVGGEDIVAEDVLRLQQSFAAQGQQMTEEEVLEQLINQEILTQNALSEGMSVTDEEAEQAIEEQLSQMGSTLDEYKQQLQSQGLSYEEELKNAKQQVMVQQYAESLLEEKTFEVTEAEAKELYENYKAQSTQEVPAFEELRPQLIASLKQEKQQAALQEIVEELKEQTDIEYK